MNWGDPIARANLIEQVGVAEYNRRLKQHQDESVVAVVNGYAIRTVQSAWGKLFHVDGTRSAYTTLQRATTECTALPRRES